MDVITLAAARNASGGFSEDGVDITNLELKIDLAMQELNSLARRQYSYSHTPLVVNSLEADYNAIITAEPTLANLSAVGIRAELKHGDVINIQGNIMFINGVSAENDYSFSGTNSEGGTEIVNVWYFEKDSNFVLNQECEFNVVEIRILNKLTPPTIDSSYYLYADELFLDGYTTALKPTARKLIIKNQAELSQQIPDYAVCVESDAISLSTLSTQIAAKDTLKYLSLPELQQTAYGANISPLFGRNSFDAATMSKFNVIIDFPKLKKILSTTDISRSTFNGIKMVILPESVEEIGLYCCCNNETVILNCKNATKIHDKWCMVGNNDPKYVPLANFVMCEDWGASINISMAATNWNIDNYVDLFENKLRNLAGKTSQNIKISQQIYNRLTAEQLALATNKNWTISY